MDSDLDFSTAGKEGDVRELRARSKTPFQPRDIVASGLAEILSVRVDGEEQPIPELGPRKKGAGLEAPVEWPAGREIALRVRLGADGEWDATVRGRSA